MCIGDIRSKTAKEGCCSTYLCMREAAIQVLKLKIQLIQRLEDGVLNIISMSFEMVPVIYIDGS